MTGQLPRTSAWLVLALSLGAMPRAYAAPPLLRMDTSLADVQRRVSRNTAVWTFFTYTAPRALERGMLTSPHLLAQLEQHDVNHRLLDGLPDTGPSFARYSASDGTAIYAFVDGRLHAQAVALTAAALPVSKGPFAPDRLQAITATLSGYLGTCGSSRVVAADAYGNAFGWKGRGCMGGTLHMTYAPEASEVLSLVVY